MNIVMRADSEHVAVDKSRFRPATRDEAKRHILAIMAWHDLDEPSDGVLDLMVDRYPKLLVALDSSGSPA